MTEIEKEINKLDNIAKLYFDKGEYTEAIECFDKILAIDPNDIFSLNKKGLALSNLGKDSEAIQYYDKALAINPNHITFLNNKGIALDNLGKYTEAIEYYDKTLKINPKNVNALNNKGVAFLKLERNEEALKSFEKVLKINTNNINASNNKGIALLYISSDIDTKECAKCFTKGDRTPLLILNVFSCDEKINQDRLHQVVKRMIEKDPLFISATLKEENENKKQQYIDIYFKTLLIVSLLHVTGQKIEDTDFSQEQEVAHYTNRGVSYNMLLKKDVNDAKEKKSPLRLNTIAKGNDPKEGKTLFDYLGIDRDCETANDDYQAFIACFTFNKQSLNQFRLYGKEEQREATGVSLVVRNSYFNNQIGFNGSLFNSIEISGNGLPKTKPENKDSEKEDKKLSLFRCIYIDPQTHQVISIGHKEDYEIYRDTIDIKATDTPEEIEKKGENIRKEIKSYNAAINVQLKKVRTQLSSLNKYIRDNKDKLDMQVVKELLIMLRYLVKHVAFKEEQECRILRIEKIDSEEVVVEENSRMFINYTTIDESVNTIYTGPMFEDAKLYRDVIRRQCKHIDVHTCDHPFFSK